MIRQRAIHCLTSLRRPVFFEVCFMTPGLDEEDAGLLPYFQDVIQRWPSGADYPTVTSMSSGAEAALLTRCKAGDAEAWDALFDLHYGAATRFVFQLASDFTREDVEEVCQEVFLTVIKSLNTFQGNSQFQTWLFRIAANKARDYRQRQHAMKRGGSGRKRTALTTVTTPQKAAIAPVRLPLAAITARNRSAPRASTIG